MVTDAIKRAGNSNARGPDGVAYAHLKNLGPLAIGAFTDLFNRSIRLNVIPSKWKLASIIPILKPAKPPTAASSYRPISLLCTPSKILERLVLEKISPHVPLSPTQHGFRPLHSTSTLLTSLTQSTLEGLNSSKPAFRTLLAAVDISKAFDTVPRHILIDKIIDTALPPNYKKWLANFLSGRQANTSWNGKRSKTRNFPNGVPQGAVLSPTLFNLFLHDLPHPQTSEISIASYADDLTIASQHPSVDTAASNLQQYMSLLEGWLTANRMQVSAPKSAITLITPWNQEYGMEPRVTLFGSPIPVAPTSKILGVTLDQGLTFRPHVVDVNTRARSRLKVMKALSSTTFSHTKESLTALYKQFIRPVMTYASMAWTPDLATTHVRTLQRTQNAALRIATGCTKTSPVHHLHAETSVLPLRAHMDMRGTQFYAAASNRDHPCHHLQDLRPTRRTHHVPPATYYRSHYRDLSPYTPPPILTERSRIHTHFVRRALSAAPPNTLLGARPPPSTQMSSRSREWTGSTSQD